MQDQNHPEQQTVDSVDKKAGTTPAQDHFSRREDAEEHHLSTTKIRIIHHPMKLLSHEVTGPGKHLTLEQSDLGIRSWETSSTDVMNPESVPQRPLTNLVGPWMRLWSRLCLLGLLEHPISGWTRLSQHVFLILLAGTLMMQAFSSVSFLLTLPRGPIFFVSLQACEHFSLLSLLPPVMALRAAAFRRCVSLMADIQNLPVFSDIKLATPRRWLVFIMVVACVVFLFLQVLHVAGGIVAVDCQQKQGLEGVRFTLFPPIVKAENLLIHYGILLLQVRGSIEPKLAHRRYECVM